MAEQRTSPVSGLFLIDKPAGMSSFSALGSLKRAIGTPKVGHAGTLDPFATGLLIALSGKMTRAASLFEDLEKEYEATFSFGTETDTLDTEGSVIATAEVPAFPIIEKACDTLTGTIRQIPPSYSAVKIKGRRAYRLARDGKAPEMPARTVSVSTFEILSWEEPFLHVRIRCSKGTYIRSLARDLGLASGSRAYCTNLRRTAIGPFRAASALAPDIISASDGERPVDAFRSLGIPIVEVDDDAAKAFRSGMPVGRMGRISLPDLSCVCLSDSRGTAAALLKRSGFGWSYSIVFD